MPGIICAIRGGPASQATIEKSFTLAREHNQVIHFLYVVNLDFLTHSTSSKIESISRELRGMGEFILLDAQEKALRQGYQSEKVIADGDVIQEIIRLAKTIDADYIVLGRPKQGREDNLIGKDKSETIRKRIQSQIRAKVIFSE